MDFKRYPLIKNDPLRAWDAADELLLKEVTKRSLISQRVLVLNDSFGYLTVNLSGFNIQSFSDSYVSTQGIKQNLQTLKPRLLHTLDQLEGIYDLIVMRVPKNLSFLEDILIHLTRHSSPQTQLICTGMVKHLAKGAFDLINEYFGNTTTSLAEKKARLIFANFEKSALKDKFPSIVRLDGFEKPFTHHSNIFSREKLDIGTRFFLEHLPKGNFQDILDLGCANGVVGIKAKMLNPSSRVTFTDESWMAVESARKNYQSFFSDEAYFHWMNSFEEGSSHLYDLILCNPPFHSHHTVGDFIAWNMFQDSKRVLKEKSGVLMVIGNRHLNYHLKLKKIFKHVNLVAENPKFVIHSASDHRYN